jgi:hypothetical protein
MNMGTQISKKIKVLEGLEAVKKKTRDVYW